MGWAQNFASKTPMKKLNWSSTTGFSYKTLCIPPAQNPEKFSSTLNPGIPLRPDHKLRNEIKQLLSSNSKQESKKNESKKVKVKSESKI